jgi:iron complex outermembrane receptor protein
VNSNINASVERLNKLALLGTTALVASFGLMSPAYAQEDTSSATAEETYVEEEGEVVATGIRQAIKTARDLKRNADTAVDSITASDVGALPDLSVAEALARVPGVVVQRFGLGGSQGDFPSPEGGGNLIRGLTLVRSEFNGRDAFSANGGRSLDFGTVPPELIGAVDVYKNSSADLIQGGIGGTINLRSLEPFDKTGSFVSASIDGTYTDLRNEWSPDYSVIASNRWDSTNGEFGLLASFSSSELQSDLHGFQVGQLLPIPVAVGSSELIGVPGGFQLRTNEVDRGRDSYYVAGQWQNNDGTFKATAKFARIENSVVSDERTLEFFPDGESSFPGNPPGNQTSVAPGFTATPFSAELPFCNGVNDGTTNAPQGTPYYCENIYGVSGLYETGVISNGLRDWLGARGANFTNLAIHQKERSMTDDMSLNIKWQPSDRLFINLDAHKTTAEFTRERLWGGTRFFSDFTINPDLDNPQVSLVTDPENNARRRFADGSTTAWDGTSPPLNGDLSDPANSFLLFSADEFADNEGDMYAVRADVEYEFDGDGWFDSIEFGARISERDQTNRTAGLNWAALSPPWDGETQQSYLPMAELSQGGYEVVNFDDFFRGGVVVGDNTSVVFADRALLQNYDAWVASLQSESILAQRVNADFGTPQIGDWAPLRIDGVVDYDARGLIGSITEKSQNLYAKINFANEFSNGMSIDGNAGLRYTTSDVSGTGGVDYIAITGTNEATFAPQTVAYMDQADTQFDGEFNTDDYWLPSFNAKWNLNDEALIRFGVSKGITRPNVSQLRADQVAVASLGYQVDESVTPGVVTGITPTQISLYGGNPNLKAITSWNFDVSYEHYFGDDNSFTLSLFKKNIKNNIVYASQTIGTETLDGVEIPVVFNGDLNQDEAVIQGFEVAYTQFFDELPGLFSNLGLQANYTYLESKTNPPAAIADANNDGIPDDLGRIYRFGVQNFLGLSDHSANIIGIYQDEQFEFRLAYNWRSDYLSSYRDFVTGAPIFQEERGYLDASAKYDFNDNLQFRVQIANILDTKAKATQQISADGQRFGRTSFLGDRRIRVGLRYQF